MYQSNMILWLVLIIKYSKLHILLIKHLRITCNYHSCEHLGSTSWLYRYYTLYSLVSSITVLLLCGFLKMGVTPNHPILYNI